MAMDSVATSRIYEHLGTPKQEIRLAHLLPCPDIKVQARVRLTTVSLLDDLEYEALSYVWGDPTVTAPILLADREWQVTTNLEAALRQLRDAEQEKVLWIDAICIDQLNLEERSVQIPLMKQIYSKASCVKVWLGEAADNSDNAMELLETLARIPESDNDEIEAIGRSLTLTDMICVRMLLQRPWWRRVWVIQEFAVARTVIMHCGAKSSLRNGIINSLYPQWANALHAADPIANKRESIESDTRAQLRPEVNAQIHSGLLQTAAIFRDFQDFLINYPGQDLVIGSKYLATAMLLIGFFRATNSRDMVYGILGLLPNTRANRILPDYASSTEKIYSDATVHAIDEMQNLAIFAAAERLRSSASTTPSWTPDWTAEIPLGEIRDGYARSLYYTDSNACNNHLANVERLDERTIGLKGCFFDQIKSSSYRTPRPPDFSIATNQSISMWRDICGLHSRWSRCAQYVAGGSREAAFERCLSLPMRINILGEPWGPPSTDSKAKKRWPWSSGSQAFDECMSPLVWDYDCITQPFITTERGYVGISPTNAAIGDSIYVLPGGRCPYVLRKSPLSPRQTTFTLVGECHIDGIMNGEVLSGNASARTLRNKVRRFLCGGQRPDNQLQRPFEYVCLV